MERGPGDAQRNLETRELGLCFVGFFFFFEHLIRGHCDLITAPVCWQLHTLSNLALNTS